METSSVHTKLKKIAYGLGIVQGLAYGILSIICIALYNQHLRDIIVKSYMDAVKLNMYELFVAPVDPYGLYYTLLPSRFTAVAWIYLILNLGWIGISVAGLWRSGGGVNLPKYLSVWSYVTILICVWDFITVAILGSDYAKCLDWAAAQYTLLEDRISMQRTCAIGFLPVLVIAAKGFVLWIVNLIFAIVLFKMSSALKKGTTHRQQPTSVPFGFQQQYAPPPQNAYLQQPHQPTPHLMQSSQNLNRNNFDYPVYAPEPNYQRMHQQPNSPGRRY